MSFDIESDRKVLPDVNLNREKILTPYYDMLDAWADYMTYNHWEGTTKEMALRNKYVSKHCPALNSFLINMMVVYHRIRPYLKANKDKEIIKEYKGLYDLDKFIHKRTDWKAFKSSFGNHEKMDEGLVNFSFLLQGFLHELGIINLTLPDASEDDRD